MAIMYEYLKDVVNNVNNTEGVVLVINTLGGDKIRFNNHVALLMQNGSIIGLRGRMDDNHTEIVPYNSISKISYYDEV